MMTQKKEKYMRPAMRVIMMREQLQLLQVSGELNPYVPGTL